MTMNRKDVEALSLSLLALAKEHSLQAVVNSRLRNDGESFAVISSLGRESLNKDRHLGDGILDINSYFDTCQAIADGPDAFTLYKQ